MQDVYSRGSSHEWKWDRESMTCLREINYAAALVCMLHLGVQSVWSWNQPSDFVEVGGFSWVNAPSTICVLVSVLACLTTQCCIWLPRGCQLALHRLRAFRVKSGRELSYRKNYFRRAGRDASEINKKGGFVFSRTDLRSFKLHWKFKETF